MKKYKRRPPAPHVPSVLVAVEKHSTRYFLAITEEDLHKSALALVRERLLGKSTQCYFLVTDEDGSKPELTLGQAAALPDGRLKNQAYDQHVQHAKHLSFLKEHNAEYNDACKAIREQDGPLALQVLRRRSDWEYERISVEPLETDACKQEYLPLPLLEEGS